MAAFPISAPHPNFSQGGEGNDSELRFILKRTGKTSLFRDPFKTGRTGKIQPKLELFYAAILNGEVERHS
jgi:hypothetical protein